MIFPAVIQPLMIAAIIAVVGLLWKIDRALAEQTGALKALVQTVETHIQNDREDFKDIANTLAIMRR